MNNPREYFLLFFDKFIRIIEENYLGEIDYDLFFKYAVEGIFLSLDEYSKLLPNRKSTDEFKKANQEVSCSIEETDRLKIGRVKLNIISQDTVDALNKALIYLKEKQIDSLLLDLRGNTGGGLDALLQMCNYLVGSKKLFYSKDRWGNILEYASEGKSIPFLQRAVLIDEQTKSAAELLALILREDGALIVGQKSYGKGVSQRIFFVGKMGFKLTTHEYFSYKTGSFHGKGIVPDGSVEYLSLYQEWKDFLKIPSSKEML